MTPAVDTNKPGTAFFATKELAEEFACARVREMWITHMTPVGGEFDWRVEWWCQ